ncbi:glycerophosphodiester phosphodiesterase family protein [Chitinophagaceae bacterium 26-R-25]|nr:glycerophosphodiester phosphodiesterase family protein [Chitinophagaceae bacterium 26-R-25]
MKSILTSLAIAAISLLATAQTAQLPKARHKFTVIAHRGDHLVYPENTLAAYAEAIRNGADYVEIDLRTTKDGHMISLHNSSVEHMTGTKGAIKEMTLNEVLALKIKSNQSSDTTTYHIPTFEQILQLCKDKIYIYIDFKDATAAAAYSLLKKYGMEHQVLVYINAEDQFKDWRTVCRDMPLMLRVPDEIKTPEGLKQFVTQSKPDVLDGSWDDYSPEMVQMVKSLHLTLWPDIQSSNENAADWDKAVLKGFNGLQTDHPLALIRYLESKGLR